MQKTKQQGFSLLEVLVAFAILAVSLGILLKIFSGGANTALLAEEYTSAVQIAESLMANEMAKAEMLPGETVGDEDDRFHWLLSVTRAPFTMEDIDLEKLNAEFFRVAVTVTWGDDGRELHLSTLKLLSKKPDESKNESQ